jgi:hypothetical protein
VAESSNDTWPSRTNRFSVTDSFEDNWTGPKSLAEAELAKRDRLDTRLPKCLSLKFSFTNPVGALLAP